jgi:metallo-beta-lactamase family protein
VLSHAHLDHCGRLPLLYRRGFRGPIHATRPCRDLARILLADSANLAARDAERENRRRAEAGDRERVEPLYSIEDAERTLRLFRAHSYHSPAEVVPGVELVFRDAGHIMGVSHGRSSSAATSGSMIRRSCATRRRAKGCAWILP